MTLSRSIFACAASAAAFLCSAPTASAELFADDVGDPAGTCATAQSPCTIARALALAPDGETVTLLGGNYAPAAPLVARDITLRSAPGVRARILGGGLLASAVLDMSLGGTLENVYVESSTVYPAVRAKEATIDRVLAHSTGGTAVELKAGGGALIRNSVVTSLAGGAVALALKDDEVTGPLRVVNVTAVASGGASTAIDNGAGGPVSIVNTIAQGTGADITLSAGVAPAAVSYSSFRLAFASGITLGTGNKTDAKAAFVDDPYDLHPIVTSPTVDTGTSATTGFGGADPDGKSRTVPDIGAYEYGDGGTLPPDAGAGGGGGGGALPPDAGENKTDTTSTGTAGPQPDPNPNPTTDAGKATVELPPAQPPVLGQRVNVGSASGTVTVRLPGSDHALPLDAAASVPVGAVVDATNGVVALTSVRGRDGKTQTGRFWGGAFQVVQRRGGDGYTELKLVGRLGNCTGRGKATAAGRRGRRLWGSDRGGRFRTRGRHGSATVRGTRWLTEDRCGGTYFRVTDGAILVRDFTNRAKVTITRGRSYLARAG